MHYTLLRRASTADKRLTRQHTTTSNSVLDVCCTVSNRQNFRSSREGRNGCLRRGFGSRAGIIGKFGFGAICEFIESKRLGGSLSLARQARRPTGGQHGQIREGAGQPHQVMQGTLLTQRLSATASLPQTLLLGTTISNCNSTLMSAITAGSWIGPACSF